MKIALFSPSGNKMIQHLTEALENLEPGCCHLFDLAVSSTEQVSITEETLTWNKEKLETYDYGFIHGFSYENPVLPVPIGLRDWSLWQDEYLITQQKFSFLYSFFEELTRRGVKVIHSPGSLLQSFIKHDLFAKLESAGLKIPNLLLTNEYKKGKEFLQNHDLVVWRPSTGRAAWQVCKEKQCRDLLSPDKPPVLLANAVSGPLRRAYFLNNRIILNLALSSPSCAAGEEHLEIFHHAPSAPEVDGPMRTAAKALHLPWCEMTYVQRDDGPVFYNVDPDPLVEELPELFLTYLAKHLAGFMLNHSTHEEPPPEPMEIPTLFTRRMLRILFEFEEIKYHDS